MEFSVSALWLLFSFSFIFYFCWARSYSRVLLRFYIGKWFYSLFVCVISWFMFYFEWQKNRSTNIDKKSKTIIDDGLFSWNEECFRFLLIYLAKEVLESEWTTLNLELWWNLGHCAMLYASRMHFSCFLFVVFFLETGFILQWVPLPLDMQNLES